MSSHDIPIRTCPPRDVSPYFVFWFYSRRQNLSTSSQDDPNPSQANNSYWGAHLIEAVNNGSVPLSRVDDMVRFFLLFSVFFQFFLYDLLNFRMRTRCNFFQFVAWLMIFLPGNPHSRSVVQNGAGQQLPARQLLAAHAADIFKWSQG
jgi:hypothetical protein